MHPTLLLRPFHHDGWVYEEKVDGYRMVAYKDEDGVRFISRNGRDHTRRFPELVKALGRLKAKTFTLDGEVAVFDNGLISRFEWLRAKPKDEPATLPVYIAFDILELAGRDLRDQPLKERRRVLERLVWHHSMIFPARRLADDGLKAWLRKEELRATTPLTPPPFSWIDHLIRPLQKRRRDRQAEGLGGAAVEKQLERVRPPHGKVSRLRAVADPDDVLRRPFPLLALAA